MENKDYTTIEYKLAKLRLVKPDRQWSTKLKGSLLTKISTSKEVSTPAWKFSLAAAFILFFLVSGTFAYSQNALPGDPFYPLKRGYERLRLAITPKKDKLQLEQRLAEKRVDELKEVVNVRNDEASDAAIAEVAQSINEIQIKIIAVQANYNTLKDSGQDTTQTKKTLEAILPVLEETQKDLNQIEEALPPNKQLQIKKIREDLNSLQNKIEDELDPSSKIEGIQDNQNSSENPTFSPSP